ncbi:hypothetical protein FACS189485_13080 [Spirochaetia bacterium]|nr:hypothetical protein FACS189485_13080 [Spirochaetia bacterium]
MKKAIALFCCFAAIAVNLSARPQLDANAEPLRVGIMPDADSLPFMVARDEGFFIAEGVNVELVNFQNPQERDAAIQAGRLDASISDLLAAARPA